MSAGKRFDLEAADEYFFIHIVFGFGAALTSLLLFPRPFTLQLASDWLLGAGQTGCAAQGRRSESSSFFQRQTASSPSSSVKNLNPGARDEKLEPVQVQTKHKTTGVGAAHERQRGSESGDEMEGLSPFLKRGSCCM